MKNKFLTLLFAFIPGAGQMYQAYMKRGLSLISMFCAAFLCCYILKPLGAAMMLIVWMYSFFDALNLRTQIGAGSAPADGYLLKLDQHNSKMRALAKESNKLLGWGCIAAGALAAYQNIVMPILDNFMWNQNGGPVFRAIYLMMDMLPEIVVCVALLVCGVWLVREPRGAQKNSAPDPKEKKNLLDELREFRTAKQPAEGSAPKPIETEEMELAIEGAERAEIDSADV